MKRVLGVVMALLIALLSVSVAGCKGDEEKNHEAAKAAWREQMKKELSH